MSFAYKELAQKAAEAERRAQFADATEIWNKAYYEARDRDQSWVYEHKIESHSSKFHRTNP